MAVFRPRRSVESCQWHPTLQDKRDEGVAEGMPGDSFS